METWGLNTGLASSRVGLLEFKSLSSSYQALSPDELHHCGPVVLVLCFCFFSSKQRLSVTHRIVPRVEWEETQNVQNRATVGTLLCVVQVSLGSLLLV